jgi:hypothetical protein
MLNSNYLTSLSQFKESNIVGIFGKGYYYFYLLYKTEFFLTDHCATNWYKYQGNRQFKISLIY